MPGPSDVAIEVKNISKTFRLPHEKHATLKSAALNIFQKRTYTDFQALDDVSFEVNRGEFFGIIGRNGCGKSTLLKIIAGIYVPTGGTVKINGRISPFLELGVGFNPELTARENIFLGGAILGLSRKSIAEKLERIIEFSELEEFIDMKFKNFSSGMQVRLAFSLAIHAQAEILLMDEVLAIGDVNFQSKCLEEFNKYREQGKTVILVTHDIGVVQRYCDRAMLLRNGRISKIGRPEDVGHEYVQQNMGDEETRLRHLEKEDTVHEHVDKQMRISSVQILDGDGSEKQVFEPGKPLVIQVEIHSGRDQRIDIGGSILTSDSLYVAGFSTRGENVKVHEGTSRYLYRIDELPLLAGNYYVNIALFEPTNFSVMDVAERAGDFKIFSQMKNKDGLILLEADWQPAEETVK